MARDRRQSVAVVTKKQAASRQVLSEAAISDLIGTGNFQGYIVLFLCALVAPLFACNDITQFLLLLEPEYHCADIGNSSNSTLDIRNSSNWKFGIVEASSYSVPDKRNPFDFKIAIERKCHTGNLSTCPRGYEYNYDFIYTTIVSENNWVCEKDERKYLSHSFYWAGSMVGVLAIGALSDHLGRVPAVILCHLVAGAAGLVTPFASKNFALFAAVRFVMGFVVLSQGGIAYVLAMEFVGTKKRSKVSNGFLLAYAATAALLPWLAYGLGDWRRVSVVTSLPLLVVPFIAYFIPESIKWQISTRRLEEAKVNIIRVAALNGKVVSSASMRNYQLPIVQQHESAPLMDIINYKRFLKIFLVTNMIWLLQNLAYTGVNSYAAMATNNPYLMISMVSAVDVLSSVLAKYLSEGFGRKLCTAITCTLAASLYIVLPFLDISPEVELTMVMVGRLMLTVAYNTQYMYAVEVYPTEVRGTSLAVRQSVGSLGNILAPQTIALSKIHKRAPLFVFGVAALLSAILSLFLPESKGQPLPQTLRDGDRFGRKLSIALQMPFNVKVDEDEEKDKF